MKPQEPVAPTCASCGVSVEIDWTICPRCKASPLPIAIPDPWWRKHLGFGFGEEQFARVEPGSFTMGSTRDHDNPPHEVTLARGFLIQRTPVTQEQWEEVMGADPSRFESKILIHPDFDIDVENLYRVGRHPVEQVTWEAAQAFIAALSEKAGVDYRLPTEAEWEYACRAGTSTDDAGAVFRTAWYKENSQGRTQSVARRRPNAWGLHDMLGNVAEWVQDWYEPLTSDAATDPCGPATGTKRVLRGGWWDSDADEVRASARFCRPPRKSSDFTGLRLARSLD